MVLVPTNDEKFPTVTVAWAAPDLHRTSFAAFAKRCTAAILAAVMAASCRHPEGKMPSGQPAGSRRYN